MVNFVDSKENKEVLPLIEEECVFRATFTLPASFEFEVDE